MLKLSRMFGLARLCLVGVAALSVSAAANGVIEISTLEELQKIGVDADFPLSGHYELTANIDASASRGMNSGRGWAPIGKSIVIADEVTPCAPGTANCWGGFRPGEYPVDKLFDGAFTGTFDGNGKTISGLYMNHNYAQGENSGGAAPQEYIVSIGLFGALDGATVKNLSIEVDTITFGGSLTVMGGALAGFSRNSIITDCRVKGTLNGIYTALAYPQGTDLSLGGLLGGSVQDDISNINSTVTLNASLTSLSTPNIVDFFEGRAGGLIGIGSMSTISGGHATVAVNGGYGWHAGGLVGISHGCEITKSSAKMTTDSSIDFINIGGLVGTVPPGTDCSPPSPSPAAASSKRKTGVNFSRAGSLAGMDYDDEIAPCGGRSTVITESYADVDLKWQIGADEGSSMGGLVGVAADIQIADSYAVGKITNSGIAGSLGGLVGRIVYPRQNIVQRSYAAVVLTGDATNKHGFVGSISSPPAGGLYVPFFPACYWDAEIEISGTEAAMNYGASGKVTADMHRQSTFTDWDFENVWRIKEDVGYPYLAWQDEVSVSIFGNRTARGVNKNGFAPTVTARGKTLSVKAPSSAQNLQVRLIDMRGRTLTRFNMTGGGNVSLNRVSAGRYFVDMRDVETGRRSTTAIVLR